MMVIPFEVDHCLEMVPREQDLKFFSLADWQSRVKALGAMGPAFTLVTNDEDVVASAGVCVPWPGVGEAWALTSNLVDSCPLIFAKSVKKILGMCIEIEGLHRVQATDLAEGGVGERWFRFLGFDHAVRLRRYAPNGQDCIMYARVL